MMQTLRGVGLWWGAAADLVAKPDYRASLTVPWRVGAASVAAFATCGAWWIGPMAASWLQQSLERAIGVGILGAALGVVFGVLAAIVAALLFGWLGFALSQILVLGWLEDLALHELDLFGVPRPPQTDMRLRGAIGTGLKALGSVLLDVVVSVPLLTAAWISGFTPAVGPALATVSFAGVGGLFIVRQATDPALSALGIPWHRRWGFLAWNHPLGLGFWLGASLLASFPPAMLLLPAIGSLAGSRYVALSRSQPATTR